VGSVLFPAGTAPVNPQGTCTAHLNDADSIVFWYLPKGAEKYRVVYADLTIGDVAEEKLPKVPMK